MAGTDVLLAGGDRARLLFVTSEIRKRDAAGVFHILTEAQQELANNWRIRTAGFLG